MLDFFRRFRTEIAVCILFSGLICGIALQNILFAIGIVLLLPVKLGLTPRYRQIFYLFCLYAFLHTLIFNLDRFDWKNLLQPLQWSLMFLIPTVIEKKHRNVFKNVESTLRFLWGLALFILLIVCLSQWIYGWKFLGTGIAPTFQRASGFYSHPLTLAYVVLILWCLIQGIWLQKKTSLLQWFSYFTLAFLIVASESRVIQFCSLIIFFVTFLSSKVPSYFKILASVLAIAVAAYGYMGDHKVGKKFRETIQFQEGGGSILNDERPIFWKAFTQIIKNHPWTGVGADIPKDKLREVYEDIGYFGSKTHFPAHNVYLQIAAEFGIPALILYLLFLLDWIYFHARRMRKRVKDFVFFLVAISFAVGGLTQNSFQDSEVRYAIMVMGIVFAGIYSQSLKEALANKDLT